MANIVPSDITQLTLAGAHSGELETLRMLQKALPNDYTVFHSVHWSREYERHSAFGEIDFVIVNRSGDVLAIEQKNGALEETHNGLVKLYGTVEKNVVDQIHRSVGNVKNKFKHTTKQTTPLNMDYLVYCPDYKLVRVNAAGLDASRIVDATAAANLGARIQALLGPGSATEKMRSERVEGFFWQSFDLAPDIHTYKQSQVKAFTRLSGGLVKTLSALEMTPLRLKVSGVAGCGKSHVARYFFDKAIAAGKRPLLVCYNRPLSEKLKKSVREGGYVDTWHGLCSAFIKQQGYKINFSDMKPDPRFWADVHDQVLCADVPSAWQFDTIIVDEGQDFEPEWQDILGLFMKEDADVLWLEDSAQNVRRTEVLEHQGFVVYHARENYRTPYSIARFIQNTLLFDFECANGLPGLGVGVVAYQQATDQKKLVSHAIQALVKKGFAHEDIVVLTLRGANNSVLSDEAKLGGVPVRRFTGEYAQDGSQVFTEGKILFDSVRRFKGQQAPAVILVDIDPDPERLEDFQRLLYTGMTRATVSLSLLVKQDNPANNKLFEQS